MKLSLRRLCSTFSWPLSGQRGFTECCLIHPLKFQCWRTSHRNLSQCFIKKNIYITDLTLSCYNSSFFSKHSGEREKFIPVPCVFFPHRCFKALTCPFNIFFSALYDTNPFNFRQTFNYIQLFFLVQRAMYLMLKPKSCPDVQQEIKPL